MTETGYKCRYCGEPLYYETYTIPRRGVKAECFCLNDNCPVKPCTDCALPSVIAEEIKLIAKEA